MHCQVVATIFPHKNTLPSLENRYNSITARPHRRQAGWLYSSAIKQDPPGDVGRQHSRIELK